MVLDRNSLSYARAIAILHAVEIYGKMSLAFQIPKLSREEIIG
jgi:hypothetical protein